MNLDKLSRELRDRHQLERGQTMSEYAIVLTVLTGSTILLFTTLSSKVATLLLDVVRLLP